MNYPTPWVFATVVWLGFATDLAVADAQSNLIRFAFRTPLRAGYRLDANEARRAAASNRSDWLKAWPEGGSTNSVELGSRIVVQLKSAEALDPLIAGTSLKLSRTVAPKVFVLQAPDAWTAAHEAGRLAALPDVLASYPVMRRRARLDGPYAYQPSDLSFDLEWPLEHRNGDGSSAGMDLNVRAAWPYTLGQGVTLAVADGGVELSHPELAPRAVGAPHFNFADLSTNALPIDGTASGAHGTEVAGLAVAEINRARMVGVAPGASLASWVIFTGIDLLVSDERLMDMYQYQSNAVSVQNHSWGHPGPTQIDASLLEQVGISNAVTAGRSGRGVLMVRPAGNDRATGSNADDDGYPNDPRAIAVAAVRIDGRVTSYSEPGACILVGAPSGDIGWNGLFTTDLLGTRGVNQINFLPPNQDLSGYVFNALGFSGTSAAAPQISGVVALMLSANPNLTYRDAQQILVFATKVNFAAQAGAAFAVVYNYATNTSGSGAPGGDQLLPMGGTDFVPIPAVFIGHSDGEALKALFQTNAAALAQIHLDSVSHVFAVTNTLLCEHVGLRVMTDHPLRGDLRITLVSPAGTRSVLQRYNSDTSPGPVDWTYYSTHHFFETSAGNWTAYFSDEGADNTGTVQFVSLTIHGVPILDTDHDGLDDNWEIAHFGNLAQGPQDDPDHDGYANLREQIMGTDPNANNGMPFQLDLSRWNQNLARLSWPSSPHFAYEIWGGTNVAALSLVTRLPSRFPETEWFTPYDSLSQQFFRIRAVPGP
jgi:subtilisin family serine protease/subtilisin-like proprotein convertase family protein